VVPGALREFDLTDVAASLAPRNLMMTGVTDGNGKNDDMDAINEDLAIIKKVYKEHNATNKLIIIPLPQDKSLKRFSRSG